jgi:Ca2+-binding RTX toxin-like protein
MIKGILGSTREMFNWLQDFTDSIRSGSLFKGSTKTIRGSRFNDSLEASKNYKSKVYGLDGDDLLQSLSTTKEHILDGGSGNDRIYFNGATSKVYGGAGNDELDNYEQGLSKGALISGGLGNDYIRLFLKNDASNWRITGGAGDDEIIFGGGSSFKTERSKIHGGSGNDSITAYLGENQTRIYGGSGNDNIVLRNVPSAKETYLYGGKGRDTLEILTNFTPQIKGDSTNAILTYSAWQKNGIGYQQKIYANGIEILRINGEEIYL